MQKIAEVMDRLIEVAITDRPYQVGGETVHQYQAYCRTCLTHVTGPTGNGLWATKRPAVKAAQAHIEQHPYMESYLDRAAGHGTVVVDSVFGGQKGQKSC